MDMYSLTHESVYLDDAMASFEAAVNCKAASASARFGAARSWASYADKFSHESALGAYRAAIELLPRLAMLGLDLQSRRHALISSSDGLARDAAACAIKLGQYDRAVELLEEGRGVFWSQALTLRTPMTDLHDIAPELEERLRCISFALEQGSLRDVSRNMSDSPQKVMSMEKEASHFQDLGDEWLATLEEVRQLEGFKDFLRPSRLSTLRGAAAKGPVVILNASEAGCSALILNSTGVRHLPFLQLTFTTVTTLVKLIQSAIASDGKDVSAIESNHAHVERLVQQMPLLSGTLQLLRLPLESRHIKRVSDIATTPDDIFRYVLAILWESIIEPVIRELNLEVILFFYYLDYFVSELTTSCRNRMYRPMCGGALQDRSLCSQYMLQVYTSPIGRKAFPITLFRRTRPPSVYFSATYPILPARSR
jgi:hypothetical protein